MRARSSFARYNGSVGSVCLVVLAAEARNGEVVLV